MANERQYRVEASTEGCRLCGTGTQWAIVEDIEGEPCEIGGMSWGSREEADSICELMNEAYESGAVAERGKNAEG